MSAEQAAPAGLGDLVRARWRPVLLGLVVGALALTLALWGVPLDEVGVALADADPTWLGAMAAIFLVQQLLRAARQLVLLRTVAPHHRFRTSLSVLCISFFFINTLPARLGEAVRPLLLYERDRVPVGAGVAMVFVERVIDLLSVFVMLAIVAFFVEVPHARVQLGEVEVDFMALGRSLATWVVPLGLGGLVGLVVVGPGLLERLRPAAALAGLPGRLVRLALVLGEGFFAGLGSLKQPVLVVQVLGLTALTWGLSAAMYPLLARSFGLEGFIDLGAGLAVLAITMLGMAVPSAPGFAGTFEAFFRAAVALFGVSGDAPAPGSSLSLDAVAVAYALTFHWWQYAVQAATAVYFLAVDRISVRGLLAGLREGLADPPDPGGGPGAGGTAEVRT